MESTPIKVVLKIKPNESDSTETFFKIKNKTEVIFLFYNDK